jgi:hypothetical protein
MPDPLPTPPPVGDGNENRVRAGLPARPAAEPLGSTTIAYRPMSGFAIAGLAVGCLFALLVLGMAAIALFQGTPFFLHPAILLAPAAGLVLSLVARAQIRASEGTQAGERLARAGLWLSLFTGLGYFVYYYVSGLAITSQANTFLMQAGPD